MIKNILLGLGVFAALFSVLVFSGKIPGLGGDQKPQGEVQMWGTIPENQMNKIIQEFNPKAKTYQVRYRYVPEDRFSQLLLEALASNVGPDMILAPYQKILAQGERIMPFPQASLPQKTYTDTYVDGASVLYTAQGALALPVSVDPMVMFYNRSLFSKHGIANPPTYWDEVMSVVPELTIRDSSTPTFVESGIALGAADIPHAKDIIMAIVGQLGQSPVVSTRDQLGNPYFTVEVNTPVTGNEEVLPLATVNRYYTQFADPGQKVYTWKNGLGDPSDAFVSERLAMYIGYASEYQTLKSRNPRALLEMTTLPQTKGYNTFVTGMQMYALATLKTSKNPYVSLTVQSQFAGAGVAPAIAALTGGLPPLRSYAGTQGLDPVLARSMLVARGWYDMYEAQSTQYVQAMIADILSYRYGVSDASSLFTSRLRDLYAPKIIK